MLTRTSCYYCVIIVVILRYSIRTTLPRLAGDNRVDSPPSMSMSVPVDVDVDVDVSHHSYKYKHKHK